MNHKLSFRRKQRYSETWTSWTEHIVWKYLEHHKGIENYEIHFIDYMHVYQDSTMILLRWIVFWFSILYIQINRKLKRGVLVKYALWSFCISSYYVIFQFPIRISQFILSLVGNMLSRNNDSVGSNKTMFYFFYYFIHIS